MLLNVDVTKPGLYRIIYRYVNPTDDDVRADVTVTPETSSDVTQSSHVTFKRSANGAVPQHGSVSAGGVVTTFVLNPGPITVALKCPPEVLVVSQSSCVCTEWWSVLLSEHVQCFQCAVNAFRSDKGTVFSQ